MKIAIYSPYLDTFGGGERYIATIAEVLSSDHQVDLLIDEHLARMGIDYLKSNLSQRFNLNLDKVTLKKAPLGKNSNFISRIFFLKKYELLFYLTDGSIFYPTAKKNILHIQSPLEGQPSQSFWGKIKLKKWDLIIYNSRFTKDHSLAHWPLFSKVIYPPVDTEAIKPLKKKKYILSVGRFFGFLKDKKHELMIKAFAKLKQNPKSLGWSLHLAGSAAEGDENYLKSLKNMAKDLPIIFYPNLLFDQLVRLYGYSSIYWHGAGYGEENPTKMEHFGISVAEAMAGGGVPVVINKGGLSEIVDSGRSGFLWDNLDALESKTLQLMQEKNLWSRMSREAYKKSNNFSKAIFEKNLRSAIKTL
ncbi:glycosyltransferase [Candidatus Daviesbacteria bacterium]|nr:glycosyltransferase [Candidatus Daviesbacteria bacterium]